MPAHDLDFHSTAHDLDTTGLAPEVVHQLLTSADVAPHAGFSTVAIEHDLLSGVDIHVAIPLAPVDALTVSVSAPLALNSAGDFVAGVLFRQAHDVVPSPGWTGEATFGAERSEENLVLHDAPPPGARTEVQFSPPRVGARYLLEFWCNGDGPISCTGSDGSNVSSQGAINVVLFSGSHDVTYTLSSDQYWWFRSCTAHWLKD